MAMFKMKTENEWKKGYILEFNQMRDTYEEKLRKKQQEIDELKLQIKNLKETKSNLKPKEKQITDSDIQKIKELKKDGLSYSKISNEIKWSKATISRVLNGQYD